MSQEKIWIEDPKVLIEARNWAKYMPRQDYTRNEKLNAIVRLAMYISFLFIVISLNLNYIFVLLVTAFLTYLVYISYDKKQDAKNETEIENYEDLKNDRDYLKRNMKVKNYVKKCSIPTNDNPFMNFLVTDKRDKKPACASYNNPEIKEIMEDKFNHKLYRDINSVYNNENSQREFYTMPNTQAMNKQTELGEWLYKTPKTCKEGNGNQCVANNSDRLNGSSYYFI
tara:strand:- start:1680 stop:2357 length:678 start_codon:yes stop_codon:yes gene_type:complete